MESEQLPILDFDLNLISNSTEDEFCRDQLTISNIGPPLREFSVNSFYVILFLWYANYTEGYRKREVVIPIEHYYRKPSYTNNPSGELAILTNYDISEVNYWLANLEGGRSLNCSEVNYWLANQTVNGFLDIAQEKDELIYASIQRCFSVSYMDTMGKRHYEPYVISSDGSSIKTYWDRYDKIFEEYLKSPLTYREGEIEINYWLLKENS
jgi:hypothetical protein